MSERPCPFCGGERATLTSTYEARERATYAHIACVDCGAHGPRILSHPSVDRTHVEARAAWNERAEPIPA